MQNLPVQQPLSRRVLAIATVISIGLLALAFTQSGIDIKNVFHKQPPKLEDAKKTLPPKLQTLVANINQPQIIASNKENIIWYKPNTNSFLVFILVKDFEGAKGRVYDFFSGYGVTGVNQIKIDFSKVDN